jgi:protocatechuate 3,4-dioxygenase, beta subunit
MLPMRFTPAITVVLFLMVASNAGAKEAFPISCPLTSEVLSLDAEPDTFSLSNNLRRKIGSAVTAEGEPIIIKGRLTDSRCVPIADAIIELWQADSHGMIRYPDRVKRQNLQQNFLGSGTASTDNLGNFEFLTVKPGAQAGKGARVNIRINHPDFDIFQTAAYFGEESNRQATLVAGEDSAFGKIYQLTIAIPGKKQYRMY